MAVVLKNEIHRKYSNYVKDYLDRGYNIIPGVGSSCSIVLSNGKNENDRVLICLTDGFDRNYLCNVFKITVIPQRKIASEFRYHGFYIQDGEALHCDCYYAVASDGVFVSSEEELQQIRNLKKARNQIVRVDNSKVVTIVNLQNVPLITQFKIMNRIHAIRGFKKATYSNVTSIQLVKLNRNKIYAKVSFELNGKFGSITLN